MGGFRLLWMLAGLALTMTVAMAWAGDGSSTGTSSAGPPKVKVDDVVETLHGHKIADPYRWLEDANSADSQEYVRAEMAYTRSILDPLPGRDAIHRAPVAASLYRHDRHAADGRALFSLYPARRQPEPAGAAGARRHSRQRPPARGRESDVGRWHGRARLVVSLR